MKSLLSVCLVLLLAFATQAAEVKRAPLSVTDKADIERAEAYLNSITTLKARFLQTSPNGTSVEGDAYLSRPGRLRLQYDPPSPLLVVADGTFLIVHDRQLGEPSYIPLGSTPAGVLVKDGVKLNGSELAVTRISRQPGVLRITVVDADDPTMGELTLVFSDKPLTLRQWQVKDAQQQVTAVSLFEAQTSLSLDPRLFQFKDPKFSAPKLMP